MKNLIYLMVLVCGVCFAKSNTEINATKNNPKVGEVLKIKAPKNVFYKHINFPRLNFIVKRGGLANYKSVHEKQVIVKDVLSENGEINVVLERKDGKKFFGYLKEVTANYNESIKTGELIKVNP